jgi:biopolymer transport protein ExbD
MFTFASLHTRRKPSLTPMIDVVFLLLVFFMLAARFGTDMALPLSGAGTGTDYSGPPRMIGITTEATTLNGVEINLTVLAAALENLTETLDDIIVLRSRGGASLQHLTDVTDVLMQAGFSRLVLVE